MKYYSLLDVTQLLQGYMKLCYILCAGEDVERFLVIAVRKEHSKL